MLQPAHNRKILVLVEGEHDSPSEVVRAGVFKRFWKAAGYDATYIQRLPPKNLLSRFLFKTTLIKRLAILRREREIVRLASESDFVYAHLISKLPLLQSISALPRPRLVLDLVDALWTPAYRRWRWEGLEDIVALADVITCDNAFTANHYKRSHEKVYVIPDSPQLEHFDAWRHHSPQGNRLVIGWIGGVNSASALYAIWEPLERLFERHSNLHLRIVGAPEWRIPPFEKVDWSAAPVYDQEKMVREVLQMEIGLFPSYDVDEGRARGVTKPLIYMAGGAVPVCRNIGVVGEVIKNGVNGLLVNEASEWLPRLNELVENNEWREALRTGALETVRDSYRTEQIFDQLIRALEAAQTAAGQKGYRRKPKSPNRYKGENP
jgi:glycosyltransferase involved in cell wall biosynthesis